MILLSNLHVCRQLSFLNLLHIVHHMHRGLCTSGKYLHICIFPDIPSCNHSAATATWTSWLLHVLSRVASMSHCHPAIPICLDLVALDLVSDTVPNNALPGRQLFLNVLKEQPELGVGFLLLCRCW